MKRQRITFIRKQKGVLFQGISQEAVYLTEGMVVGAPQGGGRIGEMFLQDGLICIRKVDANGKPIRDFGTVSVGGGPKKIVGDFVAVPSNETVSFVVSEEDAPDEAPAKPVQQQQQGQQRR